MQIKLNQFFDPADSPFEVLGFFVEYIQHDAGGTKLLGYKLLDVDEAPRPLGSDGRLEMTITEPLTLRKGTKEVVIKASPERPLTVFSMVQARCGQTKYVSPQRYTVAWNAGGTDRRVWKFVPTLCLSDAQLAARSIKRQGYKCFLFPTP